MYVFASHFHEDHFNREIFTWKTVKPDITYILSKDILKHRRAKREDADVWLAKGGSWQDGLIRANATGSNDSGVSWVVQTENKYIFHAGDLNNWYARFLTDDYPGGTIYSPEFGIDINPDPHRRTHRKRLYTRSTPVHRPFPSGLACTHAFRCQRFPISLAHEGIYRCPRD